MTSSTAVKVRFKHATDKSVDVSAEFRLEHVPHKNDRILINSPDEAFIVKERVWDLNTKEITLILEHAEV